MVTYIVTMSRPGGGASTFQVFVPALTPDMARTIAKGQFPGFTAQAVTAKR